MCLLPAYWFLGDLWSSSCIITLLRMRGPLVDVWLYVPGLCPLAMFVVCVGRFMSSFLVCCSLFCFADKTDVVGVCPRMR